jgi:hypothetical protein
VAVMASKSHNQIATLIGDATDRALKAAAKALAPADGVGAASVASVVGPVGLTGKRGRVNEEIQEAGSSKRSKARDGAVRTAGAAAVGIVNVPYSGSSSSSSTSRSSSSSSGTEDEADDRNRLKTVPKWMGIVEVSCCTVGLSYNLSTCLAMVA